MTYKLAFHSDALKEWKKLPRNVQEQFKKVLKRRLQNPHIPSAKLRGSLKNCYKIKLLKAGYRLVYQVKDQTLILTVISVGRRENNLVYISAENKLKHCH